MAKITRPDAKHESNCRQVAQRATIAHNKNKQVFSNSSQVS